MPALPTGTVTLLFTDIEGSTRLIQELGDRYPDVLEMHRQLLREAIEQAGGYEFETQGDGLFTAFPNASDALKAAVTAQRALNEYPWPDAGAVRVRMGLHTGQPTVTESGYVGLDLHRTARICTAGHGGQILLSQTTRDLVEDDLAESVGLRDLGEHRLKDLTRPQRLYQVVVSNLPSDFPPLRSLDATPNNLPIQLTSFIGREQEKAEVKQLLSTTRLLTLTGVGGAGKTRLALQVAADGLDEFKNGVWVVELAPLSDPGLVPKTVASAMSIAEQLGRQLSDTLVDYLRPKSLLLVLDNCEHVLPACAHLTDTLLRACPNLRILATSREALGLPGEAVWRVPSMSLPDFRSHASLEDLARSEAVRLFIERAVLSQQGFAVTNRNAAAVVQVCHRLDGIPLAIELAAARVKVLTVEQIASRLDDRFRLLTGSGRGVLPRQQTLRATMEWSHDLLSEPERALLRRLSVFAGGFTLEAAEIVCQGQGVEARDVVDLLTRLVERSIVLFDDHQGRYRLLETVRQYGAEKLLNSGEAETTRERHLDFFLRLAEEARQLPFGSTEYEASFRSLETEHDNIREALNWSMEGVEAIQDDYGKALRLVGALIGFWERMGHLREGRETTAILLNKAANTPATAYKAGALNSAGRLANLQNDNHTARALLQESVSIFRQSSDRAGLGHAVMNLASTLANLRDFAGARKLGEESLSIRRDLGDEGRVATSLANLANLARFQGDYTRAKALLDESLELCRRVGISIAWPLMCLGLLHYSENRTTQAKMILKESLSLYVSDNWNRRFAVECLVALAAVFRAEGRPRHAAAIFGAAQNVFDEMGTAVVPIHSEPYEREMLAARAELGDQGFLTAWAEGRAMTLEQAIEYALSEDDAEA